MPNKYTFEIEVVDYDELLAATNTNGMFDGLMDDLNQNEELPKEVEE